MKTTLYLIRHAATDANLAKPAHLQGRGRNPPLAAVGVRQAEMTRDALGLHYFGACYCSPLKRALQTATILAEPHELKPQTVDDLTECDVGIWEGLSWADIENQYPEEYQKYMANPARNGYPGGETFADVHERTCRAMEEIFDNHEGETILVVAHHVVGRVYLAGLLGLPPSQGRKVSLGNCGISIVEKKDDTLSVKTLNSMFHLRGIAA